MANPKISTKLTGPFGGRVRVGRYTLPTHVFVDFEGHNGSPDLRMVLEWRDDRAQVVELSITAKPEGRGVRTSDLAGLPLDAITRDVFDSQAMIVLDDPDDGTTASVLPDWTNPRFERDLWEVDRAISDAISAKRAPRSKAQLSQVAEIYKRHTGKGVLLAIGAALGVSERTAARRVKEARAAGLLPERDS